MTRILALTVAAALFLAPALAFAQGASPYPYIKTATMQNAVTASSGDGTTLDTSRSSISTVQVVISASGTVVLDATVDGTNWVSLYCAALASTNPITNVTFVTSITSSGVYRCNTAGLNGIRARITANTGTITVHGLATSVQTGNAFGMAN